MPLLREGHLLGGLVVNRKTAGEFAPQVVDLLKTFAAQSALAIQNARLFREIASKSRELETASRHKSEFLANMSHELRTPLNAIIGFSEVLHERMFGEINDKQAEYLADILESGRHLLSLINDILDLSKIEAGRMELDPTEFSLPAAIDNALTLVRERAHRRAIVLERTIDEGVDKVRADERKVKQVILNLLSNALKFTPEGGRIAVRARVRDGVGRDFSHRHRRRHRAGGSGDRVRRIPAGRQRGEESRGHRTRPRDLAEVHRAPRRQDLGDEQVGDGLDVRVHVAVERRDARRGRLIGALPRAACRGRVAQRYGAALALDDDAELPDAGDRRELRDAHLGPRRAELADQRDRRSPARSARCSLCG